ncbi:hypothetical protein N431DRAFT_474596 [Stipitochalara longipes BDJ]|nr:hypothetical protein N431DRAFT_474596 [Stipitochalara longipes BDJ]
MPDPSIASCFGAKLLKKSVLVESNVIQITCQTKEEEDASHGLKTIAVPELLACTASSRLRDLCSQSTRRVFTADEVLDESIEDFESRLSNTNFYRLMTNFVKWLYGSDLDVTEWASDLWYLGQALESPTFQNTAMRRLCRRSDGYDEDTDNILPEVLTHDTLHAAWDQANFTKDMNNSFDIELKFYLDVFAYIGTRAEVVRGAFQEGGEVIVQLSMIMEAAHRDGGFDGAPWDEKNLHKYLVNEPLAPASSPTTAPLIRNHPSIALMDSLNDVHPSGFSADPDIEAAVLALPFKQRLAVMNEMAEEEM